jgi:hypothetical protein
MAYTDANFACISSSLNQGQLTVTPFGGSPTVENAPNSFIYGSPNDAVATIAAANYFLSKYAVLNVGDWIFVNGTDASEILIVVTSSSAGVTTAGFAATGSVNTANIVNNAVTFAKFQQVAASSLVGNATGGLANVTGITLGNGLEFSGSTVRVPLAQLQYTTVAITAAQFNGAYAAPKLLIAAGGANTIVVLKQAQLLMTYVSANYAAGGVVAIQWSATANGAGTIASNTYSAATFQAAASTGWNFNPGVVPETFTAVANQGLYLSNITAAFTTGDSTFVMHLWYATIPTI